MLGNQRKTRVNMNNFLEEFYIVLLSIILGIIFGFISGLVVWFKFPFFLYKEQRSRLSFIRVEKAKKKIEELSKRDIWEIQVQRNEAKKK